MDFKKNLKKSTKVKILKVKRMINRTYQAWMCYGFTSFLTQSLA